MNREQANRRASRISRGGSLCIAAATATSPSIIGLTQGGMEQK
ncbi:MAG: hypothetical protein QF918_14455 [Pirellulaceae bacterium]|nr:hypothetical protein [Pirellulaceae bacterium]